jgi:hypothetical protein
MDVAKHHWQEEERSAIIVNFSLFLAVAFFFIKSFIFDENRKQTCKR